jgi:hypothetical protein
MPKTISKSKGRKRVKADLEFCRSAPEATVFMACFGLIRSLQSLYAASVARRESVWKFSARVLPVYNRFKMTVESTERFDLVLPMIGTSISTSFWRWYNWWDDYTRTLNPRQIEAIRAGAPDTQQFRPEGDWATYRSNAGITIHP